MNQQGHLLLEKGTISDVGLVGSIVKEEMNGVGRWGPLLPTMTKSYVTLGRAVIDSRSTARVGCASWRSEQTKRAKCIMGCLRLKLKEIYVFSEHASRAEAWRSTTLEKTAECDG